MNYEFPRFLADYIHRCGRVGRVGSGPGGLITNLISGANEVEIVQQIEVSCLVFQIPISVVTNCIEAYAILLLQASVRRDESLQKVNANIKRLLNARYGMYQPIEPVSEDDDSDVKLQ